MRLIILAAGRGKRLRPLTDNRPKPVVRLDNGQPILGESIDNLQMGFEFDGITVISGYKHEKLVDVITDNMKDNEIDIIHNPFYNDAGPVVSLWSVTHEIWANNVVIINGDTLYFEGLIDCFADHGNGIYLGYSANNSASEDEMKVASNSSQDILSKVGKSISSDWHGVSSGLVYISGQEYRKTLVNTITQAITEDIWMPWHNLLNIIQSGQQNVELTKVPYDSWCEIDTVSDLEDANKLI